jgi:hypothetical protein
MYLSRNPLLNMFSATAFLIFALIIWPIYLGKFICLFNHSHFSFLTYIEGIVLEFIILTPFSMYLDYRNSKYEDEEEKNE